jgi:hypothetical protein
MVNKTLHRKLKIEQDYPPWGTHLHFKINYLHSKIFQPIILTLIRLTVSGRGGYSGHMINKMAIFEDTMSMCMNYYLFTDTNGYMGVSRDILSPVQG